MVEYKIDLTIKEKEHTLIEIKKRCIKGLYVFEQAEINQDYNYKEFIYNLIIFVQAADKLFDGSLAKIVVNLQSILNNDFKKQNFRRIILECKNIANYIQNTLQEEKGDSNGKNS